MLYYSRDSQSGVEITTYVPIVSVSRQQLANAHGRSRLENTPRALLRVSFSVSRSPNKKSKADGIIPHTTRGRVLSRITARERSAGCTAGTGYPADSSIKIIRVAHDAQLLNPCTSRLCWNKSLKNIINASNVSTADV